MAGYTLIKTLTPKYALAGTSGDSATKIRFIFETCKKKRDIIDEIQIWRTTQRDENTTQKANEELISTTQKEDLTTQKSKITT